MNEFTILPIERGAVDLSTGRVEGEVRLKLSKNEVRLLDYLATRADRVVSKDELLRAVWGYSDRSESRTVYTTMQRLRTKIEREPRRPRHLLTIGQSGYLFRPLHPTSDRPGGSAWGGDREADRGEEATVAGPMDGFVGRRAALAQLGAWLVDDGSGDAGISGLGGAGKTRLAVEFARAREDDLPGGSLIVDASGMASVGQLIEGIASAIGARGGLDARAAIRLGRILTARGRSLLVIDAADGLAEALPAFLAGWGAPRPKVLATSRIPIDLDVRLPIGALGRPGTGSDAVALFVERIGSRWPRWTPSRADLAAFAALADRFDGLPLAIELACHAAVVLRPTELLDRLRTGRYRLDAGGSEGLERCIAWSYDRLAAAERQVLERCALFEGDFTASAAEAVVDAAPSTIDVLGALVDRALVRVIEAPSGRRMHLSAPVRAFAREKLAARTDEHASAQRAHAARCAALGSDDAVDALVRHGGRREYRRLIAELPNLLAAVAADTGPVGADAGRAAASAYLFLGWNDRAEALIASILAREGLSDRQRVWLHRNRGEALRREGHLEEAEAAIGEALALARAGAPEDIGTVLHTLGVLHQNHGPPDEAQRALDEALQCHRSAGDPFREALSIGEIATLCMRLGEEERALAGYKDALALLRGIGSPFSEALYLGNLAVAQMNLGRLAAAKSSLLEALALSQALDARRLEVGNLNNLGFLHTLTDELAEATTWYERALSRFRLEGDRREECITQGNLAALALRRGQLAEARRWIDQADEGFEERSLVVHQTRAALVRCALCRAEGDLPRARQRVDQARALAEQCESDALRMWCCAEEGLVGVAAGDLAAARSALERAEGFDAATPSGPHTDGGRALAALRAGLEGPSAG